MDREQAIKLAQNYAKEVKSFFDPLNIFLYGSYARGSQNSDSDIDIAIVFEKFNGDYMQTISKLHELTLLVDTKIEPVLLENSNDPSGFVKTIEREGYRIA